MASRVPLDLKTLLIVDRNVRIMNTFNRLGRTIQLQRDEESHGAALTFDNFLSDPSATRVTAGPPISNKTAREHVIVLLPESLIIKGSSTIPNANRSG
jgi:hypothetical protein